MEVLLPVMLLEKVTHMVLPPVVENTSFTMGHPHGHAIGMNKLQSIHQQEQNTGGKEALNPRNPANLLVF
jgi:hypothetical protein